MPIPAAIRLPPSAPARRYPVVLWDVEFGEVAGEGELLEARYGAGRVIDCPKLQHFVRGQRSTMPGARWNGGAFGQGRRMLCCGTGRTAPQVRWCAVFVVPTSAAVALRAKVDRIRATYVSNNEAQSLPRLLDVTGPLVAGDPHTDSGPH